MQISGHINGFYTLIGLAFLSVKIVVGVDRPLSGNDILSDIFPGDAIACAVLAGFCSRVDLRCVEPSSGEAHGLVGESRVFRKLKTKVFKCDGASGKSNASILIDSYIGVHMAIEVSFDGASS